MPTQQSGNQFKQSPRGLHCHDTADGVGHGMSEVSEHDQTILVTSCKENHQSLGEMVLVTTFEGHKYMFTNLTIKAATEARKLKNILMSLGERNMARMPRSNLIRDYPMKTEQLIHANQIYGPDLNRPKGNNARPNITQVQVKLSSVTQPILSLYRNITCSSDIMFANNITFLEEKSSASVIASL